MKFLVDVNKTRLDKFLAEASKLSRSKVQKDIEKGLVFVNGKVQVETDFVVRLDNEIEYSPSKQEEEPEAKNIPLKTLYNDHGLLIIDKPAGLSVHPGSGFKGDSLTQALLYHFKDIALVGEEGRPGIVHRLDKDTSGVMLIALTQEMYEFLKDAFFERKIKKEYIALVHGLLGKQHGMIDTPIGKSKSDFRKYSTKNVITPKESLTEYIVLEQLEFKGENYSLVKVKLHTGRTHQIRVHFASIGHPLVGDSLYGLKKEKLNVPRQLLHAKKIEVQLPDGTWIEAESELPEDIKEVLKALGSGLLTKLG